MDSQHEMRISQLLGEIRQSERTNDDRAEEGASAGTDWCDSPKGEQYCEQHLHDESDRRNEGLQIYKMATVESCSFKCV